METPAAGNLSGYCSACFFFSDFVTFACPSKTSSPAQDVDINCSNCDQLLRLLSIRRIFQGTAKLLYVTVRVFRTLLSKGLCSDETEDGDGEGDGDIDGMRVRQYILCRAVLFFASWRNREFAVCSPRLRSSS